MTRPPAKPGPGQITVTRTGSTITARTELTGEFVKSDVVRRIEEIGALERAHP